MKKNIRVLMVEDSENDALLISRELKRGGLEATVRRVDAPSQLRQLLADEPWDLVLADYRMPRFSGLEALGMVREAGLDLPFILVSGTIGEETAVAAMKAGAHDYIMKDNLARLVPAVEREMREAKVRQNRRRAEEQLRESEKLLRAILRSVADGLFVTDNEERLVMMNRAAEQMLGIASGKVLNLPVEQAFAGSPLLEKLRAAPPAKKGGRQFEFELIEGRHIRYLRAKTSTILDRAGRAMGTIVILTDLTREWELDRMKTEFISTAAHELRTPLTSIQGFSELLTTRDDLDREEQKKFLHYILKQSLGLGRIVNELLDISRIESGQGLALEMAPCDPGEMVEQVLTCCRTQTPKHRFEIALEPLPRTLLADRGKIVEVLENILSNAVKYSPAGGLVRVSGRATEAGFELAVEDQGIGMTPEQLERIFDRFYRVDASTTASGGLGLGMSIVKNIVEAHGGSIQVSSEPGRGTRVSFVLPLAPEQEALQPPLAGSGRGRSGRR
ncbi:hybrid sensor histidine kinase/response regulator [Desulfuromonas versatilis]|uniref:histidine kinase n=1 Tax=Desulfuromonas versatilis TaxID=2802975 RepID=A0ABM8HP54_9BACT|nr:ATP-binding protein [Desulfuromonas versatilis]BCR03328.1 hybrid sensor histidine kinase/response regulator [Desulfuromonas versatilis]